MEQEEKMAFGDLPSDNSNPTNTPKQNVPDRRKSMAMVSSQGHQREDHLSADGIEGLHCQHWAGLLPATENAVSVVCDALGTPVQGRTPPGGRNGLHSTVPP